jgi:hypothetical protein
LDKHISERLQGHDQNVHNWSTLYEFAAQRI